MLGFNLIEEEKNSELGFTEELQNFIDEENRNLAVVSTIDEANYTIRRIKELQEQKEHDIAEAERMLKLYKDKVKMFVDSKCSSYDFEIERLQQMLEPYIQSSLEETGKKSVKFIEGTAGYRKQEKLVDHDDVELEKEIKGIDDDKYFKKGNRRIQLLYDYNDNEVRIEESDTITPYTRWATYNLETEVQTAVGQSFFNIDYGIWCFYSKIGKLERKVNY